jgi:hypothetical protein
LDKNKIKTIDVEGAEEKNDGEPPPRGTLRNNGDDLRAINALGPSTVRQWYHLFAALL